MSLDENAIDQLSNSKVESAEILKFDRLFQWQVFEMTNCQLLSLPGSQMSISLSSETGCFSLLTKSLFDLTDDK